MVKRVLQKLLGRGRETTRSNGSRAGRAARVAVAAAALALMGGSALATIIAVQPDVVLFTPASVVLNQTQSDTDIIAFDEKQCVQLKNPLWTDQGVIPAHTYVSCHFFHMDPINNGQLRSGRARFDADIIGVISSSNLLDDSDPPCKLPGVQYPAPAAELFRGLEAFQPNDRYQIIDAGRGIAIETDVPSFDDQARVITCCPGHGECD